MNINKKLAQAQFIKLDVKNIWYDVLQKLESLSEYSKENLSLKDVVKLGTDNSDYKNNVMLNFKNAKSQMEKLLWFRRFLDYPPMPFFLKDILSKLFDKNLKMEICEFVVYLWKKWIHNKGLYSIDINIDDIESLEVTHEIGIEVGKWKDSDELKYLQTLEFAGIPIVYMENALIYLPFGSMWQYMLSIMIKNIGNAFENYIDDEMSSLGWNKLSIKKHYKLEGVDGEVDHVFAKNGVLIVAESKATRDFWDINNNMSTAIKVFENSYLKGIRQLEKDNKALGQILINNSIDNFNDILYILISINRPATHQYIMEKSSIMKSTIEYLMFDYETLLFCARMHESFIFRFKRFQKLFPEMMNPVDFLVCEVDNKYELNKKNISNQIAVNQMKEFYADAEKYSLSGSFNTSRWLSFEINNKFSDVVEFYKHFNED